MKDELSRFREAQKRDYDRALSEIRSGRKRSHWMWYIFPQLKGLGVSSTAEYYGISGLTEAQEFLRDEYLGENLRRISEALLELDTDDALKVFGTPDNLKLCSSMTLFSQVEGRTSVFGKVLDKFFQGKEDGRTMELLSRADGK